jgi:CRP-like cAMP-binding protein
MLERVVRKLESVSALSDAEKQAVRGWFSATRRIAAGEEIVREGEAPQAVSLLIEGLACRHRSLPDGRRQIMAYLIPGDLLDLHALVMGELDHNVCALTPCKIALAPHQRVTEAMEQHRGLERALWRDTLVDAALARDGLWDLDGGAPTAASRTSSQKSPNGSTPWVRERAARSSFP